MTRISRPRWLVSTAVNPSKVAISAPAPSPFSRSLKLFSARPSGRGSRMSPVLPPPVELLMIMRAAHGRGG
jgi:hypothetical protein